MSRPGTPGLLRQLNDRAALELLLASGSMTRAEVGEATGLSKVTAAQMLTRLQDRGLVHVVGAREGGRGPNAALYGVVPSSGYVAALDVGPPEVTSDGPTTVSAAIADITGAVVTEATIDLSDAADPVTVVHTTVLRLVEQAAIPPERLSAFVIGTPGVVDPRTGDIRFSFNLPSWHEGVLERLRADLRRSVVIENDVNLAAITERALGAARDTGDFALIWVGAGVGMAIMLDGRIHRGHSGGAGEIGWLPVPGAALPEDVGLPAGQRQPDGGHPALAHGLQSLVGTKAVLALAAEHGLPAGSLAAAFGARVESGGERFRAELARRVSRAVAAVAAVLDPGLVVLAGDVAHAGGADLAARAAREAGRIGLTTPTVRVSAVKGNPVLRGALIAALDLAREELFGEG